MTQTMPETFSRNFWKAEKRVSAKTVAMQDPHPQREFYQQEIRKDNDAASAARTTFRMSGSSQSPDVVSCGRRQAGMTDDASSARPGAGALLCAVLSAITTDKSISLNSQKGL